MSWLKRAFVLATSAVAFVAFGTLVPVAVDAQSAPIRIVGTGGQGVNLRSGPSTSYSILGKIPEGVSPDYHCYAFGQRIGGGPGVGTVLWWRVSYRGRTGYYSSAYDNVPYSWQTDRGLQLHYTLFRCNMPAPRIVRYDRGAAVRWALAHAKDPQPAWPNPSCAWFGSNVLMKGGLPKTNEWTDAWLPRPPRAATYTPALVSYLQRAGLAKVISLRSRFAAGKNAVPEARPGDLIVYDWDDDGTYDHTSVVVRISPGSYPDVAEWGTAEGPGTRSKYVMRGWTWREKAPKPGWLRRTYPDVTAILVHITK